MKWLKLPKTTPLFRDDYETSKLWSTGTFQRLNTALGRNGYQATAGLSKAKS